MSGRPVDRRSLLKVAAGCLALTACAGSDPTTAPRPSATRSPSSAPPPSPPPARLPGLPPSARWVPLPQEPLAAPKQTAADFVQALTTRPLGAGPDDVLAVAAGAAGPGFDVAAALAEAAPLYAEAVTSGEIVYPQFGGLVPDGGGARSACIMVVVRQQLLAPGGAVAEVVRTCDIRVRLRDGVWQVERLASIGGEPVDRPAGLDPATAAVLDDPRITLPDSARWDVHAGRVAPDVLAVLAAAAGRAALSVAVLRSGHPVNVFGTDRPSAHTAGRAVDVWAVGGTPVVAQAATGSPARAVLDGAFADPRVTQTGSPGGTDLDGRGRRSFINVVHADHLHLATGGSPPAGG